MFYCNDGATITPVNDELLRENFLVLYIDMFSWFAVSDPNTYYDEVLQMFRDCSSICDPPNEYAICGTHCQGMTIAYEEILGGN